jgi:hypothetical protein
MKVNMLIFDTVPFPRVGERLKWPWAEMYVGDEFTFVDPQMGRLARTAAHVHGYQSGKKFKTQKTKDGIRIWRVA